MKLKLLFWLLFAIFLSATFSLRAQVIKITGKVINKATGAPIVGASVEVKGTPIVTTTNSEGNYTFSIPQKGKQIVVKHVGLQTVTRTVDAGGIENFSLEESVNDLNDVVVIGCGTQKLTNVSGANSTVKAADIEKANPVRVEDAIQGRASGVNIIQSGSPGVTPTVLILGIPSYSGSNPLVIIDGVQQSLVDFNSLSPSDIESINVLKDAATTAIYGVKGGNGVIVVTTKSGRRNQKTQFNLNANYGMQEVANTIGVLNATEYAAIVNDGSTTSGGPVIFPDLSKVGVGTNWQDQIFKKAPLQLYSFSVTGGSDKVSYFLSANYADQAGIVGGGSNSDYSRSNFTANLNFQLMPKLKFILNTTGVLLNSKGVAENSFNSIIGEALNFDPTVPVYNTVPNTIGTYGFSNLLLQEVHNP
jgi:TonB-dependent SusC/RagA subfamily outer membrane receptor